MPTLVTGGGGSADIQGTGAKASGSNAHIEGLNTKATGNQSHVEGLSSVASGATSHSEGEGCYATATNSHCEGYNSQAAGPYSHCEGESNNTGASATGAHCEGSYCNANGTQSHAEGYQATASQAYSHAQNISTTALAIGSHAEGNGSVSAGDYSHAQGVWARANRYAQDTQASGYISGSGDAQTSVMVLFAGTTDATPKTLTAGGIAADYAGSNTNVYTVAINTAATFELLITARRLTTDTVAGWRFSGVITRVSAGNARLVGTVVTNTWADAGASAWTVAVTADTTNQCLKVEVTGVAAQTIGWVARLTTSELVY